MAMMRADLRQIGITNTGLKALGSFIHSASPSGNVQTPAVGDRWLVAAHNENPGMPVSVYGGKAGSPYSTTDYGVTDAFGNWQMGGSFDQSQLGPWEEDWRVGGRHIGTWDFTVIPASEARKVPPATLLKPMPSIVPVKPDQVSSSQAGVKCRLDAFVNANPVAGVALAIGIGVLIRGMGRRAR